MQLTRRDPLTVDAPTNPVTCQISLVGWSNGIPPFQMSLYAVDSTSNGTLLDTFIGLPSSPLQWFVDFVTPSNSAMFFRVQDSTGATAASPPFSVTVSFNNSSGICPFTTDIHPSATNSAASSSTATLSSGASPTGAQTSAGNSPVNTSLPTSGETTRGSSVGSVGFIVGLAIAGVAIIALAAIVLCLLRGGRGRAQQNASINPFISKKASNPDDCEQIKQSIDEGGSSARRPDLLGDNPSLLRVNNIEGRGEFNDDAPSTIATSSVAVITSAYNGTRSAASESSTSKLPPQPLPLVAATLPVETSGPAISSIGDGNSVIAIGTQFPESPDDDGLRSQSAYATSFSSQPPAYFAS